MYRAGDNLNADSQYQRGFLYEHGMGVERDRKKALHLYHEAAEKGHIASQNTLAYFYHRGDGGVEKDV